MTSVSRSKKVAQTAATGTIPNLNASLERRLEEVARVAESKSKKLLAAEDRIKLITRRNVELRYRVEQTEEDAKRAGYKLVITALIGLAAGVLIVAFL